MKSYKKFIAINCESIVSTNRNKLLSMYKYMSTYKIKRIVHCMASHDFTTISTVRGENVVNMISAVSRFQLGRYIRERRSHPSKMTQFMYLYLYIKKILFLYTKTFLTCLKKKLKNII